MRFEAEKVLDAGCLGLFVFWSTGIASWWAWKGVRFSCRVSLGDYKRLPPKEGDKEEKRVLVTTIENGIKKA